MPTQALSKMSAPTLPSTMRAWQYNNGKGGLENSLFLNPSAATPTPTKASQHIVKILMVAMNPIDYKMAELPIVSRFLIKMPATPCLDYVGRIVKPAAGSPLKPGQVVFGCSGEGSPFNGQGLAEYAIADASATVPAPSGVDLQSLATVGVGALTAYESITDHLQQGSRVFLNGGSGGVGVFGIQIAKAKGLHVTTSCSTKNVDLCRSLGADEVLDYKKGNLVKQLQEVTRETKIDLVVDNAGADMSLYWQAHTYVLNARHSVLLSTLCAVRSQGQIAASLTIPLIDQIHDTKSALRKHCRRA